MDGMIKQEAKRNGLGTKWETMKSLTNLQNSSNHTLNGYDSHTRKLIIPQTTPLNSDCQIIAYF